MNHLQTEIIRGFDCLSFLLRQSIFTAEEYPTILAAKELLERRLVELSLGDESQDDLFKE